MPFSPRNFLELKRIGEILVAMDRQQLSRRDFISRAATAGAAVLSCRSGLGAPEADQTGWPPAILVFSKVYQELKLTYSAAADLTAEAGLQGVDCPVRPAGEVLPDRVKEDLPRYAEELRRRQCRLALLTTAITATSTPHAEDILTTAKPLGIHFYRLGFLRLQKDVPRQLREINAQLKDIAALNRQLGLTALLQNHSGGGYVGGDLGQLFDIVHDFSADEIGVAFDIGHAVVVHGDGWRSHFERLKSHLRIAYVKDVTSSARWVPFGQGKLAQTGYFTLLKALGYTAPVSLHIEYEWAPKGQPPQRPALLQALRDSSAVLRQWLRAA